MEAMLILGVALLIFGPEKLPQIGRDFGKFVRNFRQAGTDITREVNRQISGLEEEAKNAANSAATPENKTEAAVDSTPVPYKGDDHPGQGKGEPKP